MVVSIASQKGGTGKTSTSISLFAGFARKGKRVLLIDVDSQANSSKVLLPNYQAIPKEQTLYTTILQRLPLPIYPTTIPNLDLYLRRLLAWIIASSIAAGMLTSVRACMVLKQPMRNRSNAHQLWGS